VLSQIRTDLFVHAQLQRNSLTLALEPASGLLTPELRRQTPDEGVHVWLPTGGKRALWTGPDAESEHPACVWHEGTLENITEQLASSNIRFERILGWFPTEQEPPISGQLAALSDLLAPAGRLLFALSLPSKAPRLSSLLAANLLDASTKQALLDAEQEIYQPLQNKDGTLTKKAFGERLQAGYSIVVCSEKSYTTELRLSAHRIQEWLEPRNNTGYFGKLRSLLAPATFQEIAQAFKQHVPHKTHPWSRTVLQLVVVRQ
jgi:putative ATPase